MIGLLQRVREASVEIGGERVGQIGSGLLVFVAIERGDSEAIANRLLERILGYRVFPDAAGKMNLSLCRSSRSPLIPGRAPVPA
jgi:D-tyrosyl-tRNA(Tyr) deacylase